MKKLIVLVLTLLLGMSFLTGCGDTQEAKRRDAAKGMFDITDSEYRKNKEYYDALLSDYYDVSFSDESDNTASGFSFDVEGEGSLDDLYEEYGEALANTEEYEDTGERGWEPAKTEFTKEEILDEVNARGIKALAVKKGDRYYSNFLFNESDEIYHRGINSRQLYEIIQETDFLFYDPDVDAYGEDNNKATVMGIGWEWPDVSYGSGDSIVLFTSSSADKGSYSLQTYSFEANCIPFVFLPTSYEKRDEITGEKTTLKCLRFVEEYEKWNNAVADGTTALPDDIYIRDINGEPRDNNPRMKHYRHSDFFNDYLTIVTGEKGEKITLGGDDFQYYYPEYKEYSYYVTCELYRINRAAGGWEPKGMYAYTLDNGVVSLPEACARPTDEGFVILSNSNTMRAPAGNYLLGGYPITISD